MPGTRPKTDEVDMEHLTDVLLQEAKKVSLEDAFQFGKYDHLQKQQAISGRDLACQLPFLEELQKVSENLLFKYVDLKAAFTNVAGKHPQTLSRFPTAARELQPGKFSEKVMTMCTHARRLKVKKKIQEACKGLPDYYVSKLEQLKSLLTQDGAAAATPEKTAAAAATPEKKTKAGEKSMAKGPSWQEILEMEIPPSQESATGLGALEESPVPPRKQVLKAAMKRPAGKLEAPKVMKKPSTQQPLAQKKAWFLMPYNEKKKWAVAVREKGGKQVVAVSKFHDKKKNWAGAAQLLKMLQAGKPYDEVIQAKERL